MNDKISMRHGYTLSFNEDGTFFLKVETKNETLEFDGVEGNIIVASEPWEDNMAEMTLEEMVSGTKAMFTDWGIEYEVTDAIIKDLTPWFEKYATDKAEETKPDTWEKVLIDRVRELEEKEQTHRENISKSVADFKKWVSTADEYSIIDNAEVRAKRVKDTRETYRAVWKRLQEAKSELEQYREAMSR